MEGSGNKALTPDQIESLLKGGRAPKGISTEPRDIQVWYRQDHILSDDGCSNPNCIDPRTHSDNGRKIVIKLQDQQMCRFCFLDGWLSPNKNATPS
jgi:hypothetical protein